MKKTLLSAAGLTAVAAFALPASAQVLGGDIGGNVGVQTPPLGSVAGAVGDTARGAADLTRDTLRDTRGAVRDSVPSADVDAAAGAQAEVGRDGAQAGAEISAGAMVHSPNGDMIGRVTGVTRDTAGRVQGYVVRTADGAERLLPSASAAVQGGVVIASEADLQRQPR